MAVFKLEEARIRHINAIMGVLALTQKSVMAPPREVKPVEHRPSILSAPTSIIEPVPGPDRSSNA